MQLFSLLTFLWAFGVFELFLCLLDFICNTRAETFSARAHRLWFRGGAECNWWILPTRPEQDDALSNEKQTQILHSWERERARLFHYGNYCNYERGRWGGKPCVHRQQHRQAHPLLEITALSMWGTRVKVNVGLLSLSRSTNPRFNLHI